MADVFGEGADVSATRDVTADFEFWIVIAKDFYIIYGNFPGGNLEVFALASEFVGALAVDFDGGETRRGLGNFTYERANDRFNNIQRGFFGNGVAPARRYGWRAPSVSVVTSDRFLRTPFGIFRNFSFWVAG